MRCLAILALTLFPSLGTEAPDQTRRLILVLGSLSAETARPVAKASQQAIVRWLGRPGSEVTVSGADSEPLVSSTRSQAKEIARLLEEAVSATRDTEPAMMIARLDQAVQQVSREPGLSVVGVVLDTAELSTAALAELEAIRQIAAERRVRIIIWSLTQREHGEFRRLAETTGGTVVRSGSAFDRALITVGAVPAAPLAAGNNNQGVELPALPNELTVRVRFLKTSPLRNQSFGTQRSFSSSGGPAGGGINTREGGPNSDAMAGPARGTLIVEVPLDQIRFVESGRNYLARLRLSQRALDAGGRTVWQQSREVTVQGPLEKLPARRQGTLYFGREVQLPAGRYTVEGVVEDLIAEAKGGARRPVETAKGLPGFNVSDLVFVRKFSASSDRLEADQVFAYDGEALAPMLEPVFAAGQPQDAKLLLTIYPNLNGEQPEINLEILRAGEVVGRLRLPFTDQLKDTSREGIGSIGGEQKSQFPYLAQLRGMMLPPGDYEARVQVRQGMSVLTRSAFFRVAGAASPLPAGENTDSSGSAREDTSAAADEAVRMPELDPITINPAATAMPADSLREIWREAGQLARRYVQELPNFRCTRETRRLWASTREPAAWHERDVVIGELAYEDGRERSRILSINGLKADGASKNGEGLRSQGEFGLLVKGLFEEASAAEFEYAGETMANGVLCRVFRVAAPARRSHWILNAGLDQELVAYRGVVLIDTEFGLVRRLTLNGEDLRKRFPLQSPSISIEYGLVRVGEEDHLLPLRSVLQLRQGRRLVRNETRFRDYRRFQGESTIRFSEP